MANQQAWATGTNIAADNLARQREIADEKRKGQLKTLLEDATTPQDKMAAYDAVYHQDPSVLKQHVENLTRRITGKPTQPVVSPAAAQQGRIAPLAARGQTPAQQQTGQVIDQDEKRRQWIQGLPPDQQRLAMQIAGIRGTPKYVNWRNTKTGETMTWDANEGPPGPDWVLSGTSGGFVRQSSHVVTPKDAISLMNSVGQSFPKQDGKPWTAAEIAQFPPGIVLAGFIQGNQTFYAPFDQRARTATIGNEVYQIPEAGEIGSDTTQPLGVARVPSVGTHQVPGMNPGETVTLHSSTTPQTPGASSMPGGASTPAAGPAPAQPQSAPAPQSEFMVGRNPKGLVEAGNLPIWNRPAVQNGDGSVSSEYSTSFQDDQGREVLVPTVVNGRFLTPDGKKPPKGSPQEKAMFQAAWQNYLKTGKNLGKFDNAEDSDAYAGQLHNRGMRQPATKGPAPKTSIAPSSTNGPQPGIGPAPPPFAKGTMLSQGRNAEPVVGAMSTVAAQVFGENGEQPIWNYAKMFDDPNMRSALNNALTLNALAIPGTQDDPSFMQTLMTAVGMTEFSQEQVNQANVDARDRVQQLGGDEGLAMLDRMAGLQEDLSALRAATKGSAAQGSIRTLVRAAPIYNVSSSQDFRNRLGVTLNTAAASMAGYPAINPAYLDWLKRGAQMARGNMGPAPTRNNGGGSVRFEHSASTGRYRYSTDGGRTWQKGKPPSQMTGNP